MQLNLFDVAKAYCDQPELSQKALYDQLKSVAGVDAQDLSMVEQIGKSGAKHSVAKRKIRWHQQTLKAMGLLERVERGRWRLSAKAKGKLLVAQESTVIVNSKGNF